MALFSTLASATNESNTDTKGGVVVETAAAAPTSSATIATVIQLYSNQQIILMEDTPSVTGFTSLTYQAVQVGATRDDTEPKNRHSNPDLGVWNCRIVVGSSKSSGSSSNNENGDPLVDSLLAKLAAPAQKASQSSSSSSVYCLTIDLSDEATVEPNLSALQAALVRHLIEHPPPIGPDGPTKIQTTSLYDLQTAQFGLASEEKAAERSIEESAKNARVGLMICAVVSSNDNNNTIDESSESAYKKKQARALVIYHLRKFASSINAALCFVERPKQQEHQRDVSKDQAEAGTADVKSAEGDSSINNNNNNTQLAVSYDKLSQLWRDMATGIPVWDQQQHEASATNNATKSTETAADAEVSPTALYGPGRQQEDLIESLLLRNANYPGHWDASKDSLWVALPAASEGASTASSGAPTSGDDGWLTQLRDSIASALPADKADDKEKNPSGGGGDSGKPKEKDAAVSSFFESLLKNP
mmetsp:Transcript_21387/g.48202  ORF Transcript_21387/g.48202 Transcript_21387/m.48202 type:complete len:474 (-) Transcript_21387:89-1510(-)